MNYPETPKVKITYTKSGGILVDGKPITRESMSMDWNNPLAADKMMENAIWTIGLPLMRWGVTESEARKTTIACMKAQIERTAREWTNFTPAPNVKPQAIVRTAWQSDCREFSPELIEQAIFALFQDDITGIAEAVANCPAISKRFQSDPAAFWKRLSSYAGQKSAGARWLFGQPTWVKFAVKYWIRDPAHAGISLAPPVCLWADTAIQAKCEGAPADDSWLRKKLSRDCRLYRPQGFAYAIEGKKWVRCKREAWGTKRIQSVPAP